jgi:hypothetical protein
VLNDEIKKKNTFFFEKKREEKKTIHKTKQTEWN